MTGRGAHQISLASANADEPAGGHDGYVAYAPE